MADPKILKGEGRKTIYQPRPHLSQMHTTIYRPFSRKKAAFWKKNEPLGGSFESASVGIMVSVIRIRTALVRNVVRVRVVLANNWTGLDGPGGAGSGFRHNHFVSLRSVTNTT